MAPFRLDDYIDADVAYLAGLIVARGTIETGNQRRLIIQFPFSKLKATGITKSYDQGKSINLGMAKIRERMEELLSTYVKVNSSFGKKVEIVADFTHNSMTWRNILLLMGEARNYHNFEIPPIIFDRDLPKDWKIEFIKGFGDVAGNVRKSNRYINKRFRVRLDVMNSPKNWVVPVQLCSLLQDHLDVPVQMISWGHPNMNRGFREHQINIFAEAYLPIGFSLEHKQEILAELAAANSEIVAKAMPAFCPGRRKIHGQKEKSNEEKNKRKLDKRLAGKHFNSYWQICGRLGCPRQQKMKGKIGEKARKVGKKENY